MKRTLIDPLGNILRIYADAKKLKELIAIGWSVPKGQESQMDAPTIAHTRSKRKTIAE